MDKNTYSLVNKFECCGKMMVTVIIEGKAVCVMFEFEYNRIFGQNKKRINKYGEWLVYDS